MLRVTPRILNGLVAAGLCSIAAMAWAKDAAPQLSLASPPAAQPTEKPAILTADDRKKFVQTYCVACHNQRLKTAGLVLEGLPTDKLVQNAAIWEKVAGRLEAGEMPPKQIKTRPDAQAAHAMAQSLVSELDGASKKSPFAGRTIVRRLSRTEYGNVIRDLLHIDFPYADELPRDATADGFDNVADSLSMSPVLLESYLKVASKVAHLAIGNVEATPVSERYIATQNQSSWQGPGMPLGSRGGVLVKRTFARAGEYDLRAFLAPANLTPIEGVRFFHTRVSIPAGDHTFIATFLRSNALSEGPVPELAGLGGTPDGGPLDVSGSAIRPILIFLVDGKKVAEFEVKGPTASEAARGAIPGPPLMQRAEITGPFNAGPVAATGSRKMVLLCEPKTRAQETACARKNITAFLRRAWRREVSDKDIKPYLASYTDQRATADFDEAMAAAVRDMLVSPEFIFRLEFDPKSRTAGSVYRVNDTELASRLSFFLWGSIPDERLLSLARSNQLHKDSVLNREVVRMLADRRADSLVDNFAFEWLGLRNGAHSLDGFAPTNTVYPQYDKALGEAFETEIRLFLRSIIHENRSLLDVIDANYTFVNERLAANYGIPGVKGDDFRRITLPANAQRGGVLGMGAILMPNSHTGSTSPVYRGEWVLTNILNAPPKPPPNGVPPLSGAAVNGRILTLKEQMERHRANPVCASCHVRMDPYGFALENFDVLGRWRDGDAGGKIDATGVLPNGTALEGPAGLRKFLKDRSDVVVAAATSRMMTYALGRRLDALDMPAVRAIVRKTAPDYRFQDVVLGVVHSTPFLMKQTEGGGS